MYCEERIAQEIYEYFKEQEGFSVVPDDELIVIEKFKAEKEFLLFHSVYGRRVNDALARAFAFAAARLRYRDVEIGVNDNGFFIFHTPFFILLFSYWIISISALSLRLLYKNLITIFY